MDLQGISPSAALAVECEQRFQANLHALSRIAPEVAEIVRETVVVVTCLQRSRDGSIACRLETAAGDRRWVGGSVIPRWAAAQVLAPGATGGLSASASPVPLAACPPVQANRTRAGKPPVARVLARLDLPEAGSLFLAPFDGGYTLNALLDATHAHQDVFVLEHDPDLFAGTLMVTDLQRAFVCGRVRFFLGPGLGEQVAAHLREHPWDAAPEHLITTSTVPETVALYRSEVALAERLVAEANRHGPGTSHAA